MHHRYCIYNQLREQLRLLRSKHIRDIMKKIIIVVLILGMGLPLVAMERDGQDDEVPSLQQLIARYEGRKAKALEAISSVNLEDIQTQLQQCRDVTLASIGEIEEGLSQDGALQNTKSEEEEMFDTFQGVTTFLATAWGASSEVIERESDKIEGLTVSQFGVFSSAMAIVEENKNPQALETLQAYMAQVRVRKDLLQTIMRMLTHYSNLALFENEISRLKQKPGATDCVIDISDSSEPSADDQRDSASGAIFKVPPFLQNT